MRLSANFTLEELTHSEYAIRHGLDNSPPDGVFLNLIKLAGFLEDVRALLGDKVINISSGYRSPAVNAGVGGAAKSHHLRGLAADFNCYRFGSPLEVCQKIAASGLRYDQCIHEYGRWIHIAIDDNPRRQNLTAVRGPDGKTIYQIGHNRVDV